MAPPRIYDWNMTEEDRKRLVELRKLIDIKENFDISSLIRRAETTDAYILTAKFRLKLTAPERNTYSKKIVRKRKRPLPVSRRKTGTTSGNDADTDEHEDPQEPEFDFDADDDHKVRHRRTSHCQDMYMKACKAYKVYPIAYFHDRGLRQEKCFLRHRQLVAKEIKTICVALLSNSSIEVLDVCDNDMGAKGAEYIAEMLTENIFIHTLGLADNHLGLVGVKHIVDVVVTEDNIKNLDLSGNRIRELDAEVVRPLFENTSTLKELNLSHNELREEGGAIVAEALLDNETIESLDLSWNHLRRDGGCYIAEALAENKFLKKLNVAWNGFFLDGCGELAKALDKNTTLIELDVSCNRINKDCLEKLLGGIKKNTTLECLHIGLNPLTPIGAMMILEFLRDTPTTGIWRLDLTDQQVEPAFVELLNELQISRYNLQVIHGTVLGHDKLIDDDQEMQLMDENPIIVLMEFGKLMGFRLMDLFASLDKDGSKTLSHEEIREGLRMVNIPLSDKCIEILIDKLDVDGDGEVDFGELMAAQLEHRKKMSKFYFAKEHKLDLTETEIGRVRLKLSRLMAKEMSGNPQFRRQSQLLLGQVGLLNEMYEMFPDLSNKELKDHTEGGEGRRGSILPHEGTTDQRGSMFGRRSSILPHGGAMDRRGSVFGRRSSVLPQGGAMDRRGSVLVKGRRSSIVPKDGNIGTGKGESVKGRRSSIVPKDGNVPKRKSKLGKERRDSVLLEVENEEARDSTSV